jgi:crossover junction endodeoxyribonuclease RuvC
MVAAVIGIDPGLAGALAVVALDGSMLQVDDIPLTTYEQANGKVKQRWDEAKMVQLIEDAGVAWDLRGACIEKPLFLGGNAAQHTGTIGCGWGMWVGILAAFGIPRHYVSPADWKRDMFSSTGLTVPRARLPDFVDPEEARRLAGERKKKQKAISRELAQRLYPTYAERFRRIKDDGRAEAVLIATYYTRLLQSAP